MTVSGEAFGKCWWVVSNPEGLRCCLGHVLVHLGSHASLLPLGAGVLGSPFLVSNMRDFQQSAVSSNVTSTKQSAEDCLPAYSETQEVGPGKAQ